MQSWRSFETQDLYRCKLRSGRCVPLSVRLPEPVAVESLAISSGRRHVVLGGVLQGRQNGIIAGVLKQGAAFRVVGERAEKYQLIGWCSDTEVLVRYDESLVIVDVNRGRQRVLSRA